MLNDFHLSRENAAKRGSRRLVQRMVLGALAAILAFHLGPAASYAEGPPRVIPALRQWSSAPGVWRLTKQARIVCRPADYASLRADLEQFQADLALVTGVRLPLSQSAARPGDIVAALGLQRAEVGKEGYLLEIGECAKITADDVHGAFHGLQTLLQLLAQGDAVPRGSALDYPDLAERGLMVDCGRRFFEVEYLERLIRRLAWLKLNFIHLHLSDVDGFRIQSDLFPGLAAEKAYSKADLRRLQDFAKKYHVVVVPEIDLPAHATAITDYNPHLGFRCSSMRKSHKQGEEAKRLRGFTLDVTRREVRLWVSALLEEMIPLFDGPYFHIGGDEWPYDIDKYQCPELMQAMTDKGYEYPGDLFVEWINEMNEQVKSHGKTTQIWSWWRFSPSPEKQNKTSIQPAKDIVINIWNRPSRDAILADGYQGIICSEEGPDALYITPAQGTGKPGDYGVFQSEKIYTDFTPQVAPRIKGYKACLWCDEAQQREDKWFDQFYDLPLTVLADRIWGSPRRLPFEEFKALSAAIGNVPSAK